MSCFSYQTASFGLCLTVLTTTPSRPRRILKRILRRLVSSSVVTSICQRSTPCSSGERSILRRIHRNKRVCGKADVLFACTGPCYSSTTNCLQTTVPERHIAQMRCVLPVVASSGRRAEVSSVLGLDLGRLIHITSYFRGLDLPKLEQR